MVEEVAQQLGGVRGQRRLIQRVIHQLHPPIARALIELEWHVPHAQARVAAHLFVAPRPAEAADQEIAQPFFRTRQIVVRDTSRRECRRQAPARRTPRRAAESRLRRSARRFRLPTGWYDCSPFNHILRLA